MCGLFMWDRVRVTEKDGVCAQVCVVIIKGAGRCS